MLGDVKCTKSTVSLLTITGFLIGMLSAITGIGAGVMVNAVLLRLDVHPRVATETG